MSILSESLSSLRRTPLMSLLTSLVISVTLAVCGIFAMLVIRAQEGLDLFRSKMTVEAYFKADISTVDAERLYFDEVLLMPEISRSIFISKEDALDEYREHSGEDVERIAGYNPMPAGFRVTLRNMTSLTAAEFEKKLRSIRGIDEVIYDKATLSELEVRTSRLFAIGISIGIFLVIVSIAVTAATVQLASTNRRDTVRAMTLLGAGRMRVVLPFIIESLLSGAIGGVIGFAAVMVFEYWIIAGIEPDLVSNISQYAEEWLVLLIFVAAGAVTAFIGSMLSVPRITSLARSK